MFAGVPVEADLAGGGAPTLTDAPNPNKTRPHSSRNAGAFYAFVCLSFLQRSVDFALHVFLFQRIAFVVALLPFCESDQHFRDAVPEVNLQRHERHASRLGLLDQVSDLLLVQQ